MLLKNQIIFWF